MANEEIKQEVPVMNKIKVIRNENDGSIINIELDGQIIPIMFEDIAPYWKSGVKSAVASIGAYVQGTMVICWVNSSNGAQGAIFIWDSRSKKIIHVSEGSFTRKAMVFRNLVISLRELPKSEINDLVLCVSPGPVMNADEKKYVQAVPLNIKIFDKKFNIDNYKLGIKDDMILAGFRNEIRQIKAQIKPNTQAPEGEAKKPTLNS